ncbi:MAG TPA: hypothetical protein VMF89_19985, partial [Polyangiales bacterium]|nr:hypothetical protein [Polyangiales bacterium]
ALLVHFAAHNVPALTELLTRDVLLCNDADEDQVAAHRIVRGRGKVMMFQFKTARSGRFAFKVLNGQPALVVELPPKLAPSSGRVIGEAAPEHRPSARERVLPRQAVLWIELDAAGNVAALHIQTQRRKLEHLPWQQISWPPASQLAAALVSALRFPQRGAWRLRAAGSLVRSLRSAVSRRG